MPTSAKFRCHYEAVDTVILPAAQRFEFWEAVVPRRTEVDLADCSRVSEFQGKAQGVSSAAGVFAEIYASPFLQQRSHRLCQRDGVDDIHFVYVLNGRGTRTDISDARRISVPGTLNLLDLSQPAAVSWIGENNRALHLSLPRPIVTAALGGRALDSISMASASLAPMLQAQMLELAEILPSLNTAARSVALQITIDMAITVLMLATDRDSCDMEQGEDGLFAAARQYILSNIASPALTPDRIAARLGCSRAHLYRVFAHHGVAVVEYIRDIRLQLCRTALERPHGQPMPIGDLAFSFGFQDPTYFARLFKRRFGCSPQEMRRMAGRTTAQSD